MRLTGREFNSVFRIKTFRSVGTAFFYFSSNGCCFLTAAHVMDNVQAGERIEFQRDNGWQFFEVAQIERSLVGADICAFSLVDFTISHPLPPYPAPQIGRGDRMVFLGFPHNLLNIFPGMGFATPLLRNAYLSGITVIEGIQIMILDGFNNPGYSGGPVYGTTLKGEIGLAGVVSGYRRELPSQGRIYRKNPDGTEEELPDIYTKSNSGMVQAIPLGEALPLTARMTIFNRVGEP